MENPKCIFVLNNVAYTFDDDIKQIKQIWQQTEKNDYIPCFNFDRLERGKIMLMG